MEIDHNRLPIFRILVDKIDDKLKISKKRLSSTKEGVRGLGGLIQVLKE